MLAQKLPAGNRFGQAADSTICSARPPSAPECFLCLSRWQLPAPQVEHVEAPESTFCLKSTGPIANALQLRFDCLDILEHNMLDSRSQCSWLGEHQRTEPNTEFFSEAHELQVLADELQGEVRFSGLGPRPEAISRTPPRTQHTSHTTHPSSKGTQEPNKTMNYTIA